MSGSIVLGVCVDGESYTGHLHFELVLSASGNDLVFLMSFWFMVEVLRDACFCHCVALERNCGCPYKVRTLFVLSKIVWTECRFS